MAPNFHFNIHHIIILALTHFVIRLPSNEAEITSIRVSFDSRPTIILTEFCFSKNGHVSLAVSNVSVATTSAAPTNNSRFSFILVGIDVLVYYAAIYPREDGKLCIADDDGICPGALGTICRFDELSYESSLNSTLPVPTSEKYGIYFSNCQPNSSVSMDVVIETYNLNNDTTKDYLGMGETEKPKVFFRFALFYVPFRGFWMLACCINKEYVRKIHWMMAVLLLSKALNLLCAAEDKHYTQVTVYTVSEGMVPIVKSIRYLKESAKADGTAATTLARMTTLKIFIFCVLVYWYATRTMKYTIGYDDCHPGSEVDSWVETFTIIFYIVMFYLFRPTEENEYLVVQDEEVALATIRTEFENF
ncbi:hypothetical protein RHSIM_Rhsim07G0181900 [Rhododendron simsii]|uniref:CAND6/7 N-terminal domain-containing protein n=1 Tax=Rhododendron simsii TaxID=118357 RepID=A0A834GQ42_RHOSS|nr:hypothetical protein RHSIM_Rhsim07G0181900 [Rhododendron simsii]